MTEKTKTGCFNLVDERWLPVTLAEGFPDAGLRREPAPRVSLREAFEFGENISDLRCYAHERIALMRLLICIAQRALDGPENEADWKACKDRLERAAVDYLERCKPCFNLFGEGPRFLQAHAGGQPGEMGTFRLALVDKDTSVLFDRHVERETQMEPAHLAVSLTTFQSFAAGGKTGGSEQSPSGRKKKGGEIRMEPQTGEAALCRDGNALHSFIVGASLLETIHWNLICRSQIAAPMTWTCGAVPVWELGKAGVDDLSKAGVATSYLGRLAPLARAVWLGEDGATAEIGTGLRYGVFGDSKDAKTKRLKPGTGLRELTASIHVKNGDTGQAELVSASAGGGLPKASWRELHSVAVLVHAATRGGPVALEHLRSLPATDITLWCGALVGDQAKVGDVIESTFHLPVRFFGSAESSSTEDPRKLAGPNRTYREGVRLAEGWSRRLQGAVMAYFKRLGAREFGKKARNQAALRYWTTLETRAEPVLLYDVALGPEKNFNSGRGWIGKSSWGREVRGAAADAYSFTCPRTTPRQLRAYAAGLAELFEARTKKSRSVEAGEDGRSDQGEKT